MKTYLLCILLLLVSCIVTQAQTSQQEYRPFAQDEKKWETQVGGIMENLYGNCIDGDTLINGETWKKVYNYVAFPDFGYSYYAAVRDVGKKVYAIAKGSKRARLLYDFYLKEGDFIECGVEGNAFGCLLEKEDKTDTLLGFPFKAFLKVERIDIVKAQGLEHRRFTLTLLDSYKEHFMNGEEATTNNVIWVEGVGSGAGPFSPWMPFPPRNSILLNCEINRTCIFAYPDFYEADASSVIGFLHSTTGMENPDYDLQGRPVSGKQRRGLYIRGGRVWVAE